MTKPVRPAVDFDLGDLRDSSPIESVEALPATVVADEEVRSTRGSRWVDALFIATGLVLVVMASAQWYESYQWLQSLNDWLGYVFAGISSAVTVGILALIARSVRQGKQLARAKRIREQRFGSAQQLSKHFESYFSGAEQSAVVRDALAQLPDYFTEDEARNQLQQTLMAQLDQQASEIITRHSQDNALMVAVSPFIWLDMLLSVWRTSKMISEVGALYGVRATGLVRWRIYREVLRVMVFAGASEAVIHQLPWASSFLGRAGQAVGVAIYTARIGVHTAKICRPLALPAESKTIGVSAITRRMIPVLKARLQIKEKE